MLDSGAYVGIASHDHVINHTLEALKKGAWVRWMTQEVMLVLCEIRRSGYEFQIY